MIGFWAFDSARANRPSMTAEKTSITTICAEPQPYVDPARLNARSSGTSARTMRTVPWTSIRLWRPAV
jgi:hypothetical protein